MGWLIGVLLALAAAWGIGGEIVGRRHLNRTFGSRRCNGRAWRGAFPKASPEAIREFLKLFIDEFGLPRRLQLRFLPTDRVMDVYRALYPRYWSFADNMEFESYASGLARRYGVDVDSLLQENCTLGEVFNQTQAAA